jgi:hypothetical protein
VIAHRRALVVAALLALAAGAPTARADLAQTLQADLTHPASAVPSPTVQVGAPVGDEVGLGPGAVVARVTMTPPVGTPLSGLLVPPGLDPLFTTTADDLVLWDFAVLEAAKHAVAAGNRIDAISITRNYIGKPPGAYPDLIDTVGTYTPPPSPGATMSRDEIETAARSALPAWAAHADVSVLDDYAGERVIAATMLLPASAFLTFDVEQVLAALASQQYAQAEQGARIGRITLTVTDPTTAEPLYAGATDPYFGASVHWYHPVVQGVYVGEAALPETSAEDQVDWLTSQVGE